MLVENQGHVPDILDCIANLSSDEVFTPPDVANQVLDLLPKEIWSNPEIKILDPCTKTGIFLRESARRLMIGLEKKIPDEIERREHIFKHMLFGIAITELTGLVTRRSLYYSKDAKNDYSVVQFKDSDGNIQFKRMEHHYVQGKCKVCGSPYENLERGDSFENYAYQFIHEEESQIMKFDVIVGNPPYQLQSDGFGAQATPIYQLFVEQAFRMKPRYVAMIIPSRWFAGGMGLNAFRKRMLDSTKFTNLVDFPNAAEMFPGVDIAGGICYFLHDEKHDGPCTVKTFQDGRISSESSRFLGEHGDVFVRFNEALPILEKVKNFIKKNGSLEETISAVNPFGIATNFKDYQDEKFSKSVLLQTKDGAKYIQKSQVPNSANLIPYWKVLVAVAYGERGSYPYLITSKPRVLAPNSVCTMTYLVAGYFESELEARNYDAYLRTKFVRFLVAVLKNTQHVSKSKYQFVPKLDMNKRWTDKELYKKFGIDEIESKFIDSLIREMPEAER
jgi:site-specific DNA-methyltransferase (adenine-specific)